MEKNMQDETISFIQRVSEYGFMGYIWILILSFWAGTARYLSSLDGNKPTFLGWLTETCLSGFVGVLAATACQYYALDFLLASAITGVCAHNAAKSLSLASRMFKKNTRMIEQMIESSEKKLRERGKKNGDRDRDSE